MKAGRGRGGGAGESRRREVVSPHADLTKAKMMVRPQNQIKTIVRRGNYEPAMKNLLNEILCYDIDVIIHIICAASII